MEPLPLPSKARLHQIISGIPFRYGYNEVALQSIKQHFHQEKAQLRRCGVLLIDEIKLKQAVAFSQVSYKLDSFVDCSGVTA